MRACVRAWRSRACVRASERVCKGGLEGAAEGGVEAGEVDGVPHAVLLALRVDPLPPGGERLATRTDVTRNLTRIYARPGREI